MKCKFCGCNDERACVIPMTTGPMLFEDNAPILATAGQLAQFTTACRWIAPHICSAPACVDRAYVESCEMVTRLFQESA